MPETRVTLTSTSLSYNCQFWFLSIVPIKPLVSNSSAIILVQTINNSHKVGLFAWVIHKWIPNTYDWATTQLAFSKLLPNNKQPPATTYPHSPFNSQILTLPLQEEPSLGPMTKLSTTPIVVSFQNELLCDNPQSAIYRYPRHPLIHACAQPCHAPAPTREQIPWR